MSNSEIKNHLHQLIDSFDEQSLSKINSMVTEFNEHKEIYNQPLSATEIAGIERGLKDVENGDTITLEEFLKNKPKWDSK
jgi:predicted transcriptional regulator